MNNLTLPLTPRVILYTPNSYPSCPKGFCVYPKNINGKAGYPGMGIQSHATCDTCALTMVSLGPLHEGCPIDKASLKML